MPEEYEEKLPDALRERFPVLLRLREWAGHRQCLIGNGRWTRKQLEAALACWIDASSPGGLTAEVLREELAAGHNRYRENDSSDNAPRALRGGSWYFGRDRARAVSRRPAGPDDRHNDVGFRLCCAPSIG